MATPNQEQRELTWSEILEIGVENFFDFPLHVRLTTLVIPIGLLFIIIGIFSNSWSHSDSDSIGLWKYCSTFSYIECCESIVDFRGGEPPGMIFYCYARFTGFITRVTRRVSLVEEELFFLPEHLSSFSVISGIHVTPSFVLYAMFYKSLFALLSFFLLAMLLSVLRCTESDTKEGAIGCGRLGFCQIYYCLGRLKGLLEIFYEYSIWLRSICE